jgi:dihydropteroate synthase
MIGELAGIARPSDRDPGSIAIHLMAVDNGARLVRVHDVAGHKQALDIWSAFHR